MRCAAKQCLVAEEVMEDHGIAVVCFEASWSIRRLISCDFSWGWRENWTLDTLPGLLLFSEILKRERCKTMNFHKWVLKLPGRHMVMLGFEL